MATLLTVAVVWRDVGHTDDVDGVAGDGAAVGRQPPVGGAIALGEVAWYSKTGRPNDGGCSICWKLFLGQ